MTRFAVDMGGWIHAVEGDDQSARCGVHTLYTRQPDRKTDVLDTQEMAKPLSQLWVPGQGVGDRPDIICPNCLALEPDAFALLEAAIKDFG